MTRPEINDPFGYDGAVLRWNSPWRTAADLPRHGRPAIFLAESTNDGYYTSATRAFDGRLASLGIPHTARLYEPPAHERMAWRHSWRFVSQSFADMLPAISASLEVRL